MNGADMLGELHVRTTRNAGQPSASAGLSTVTPTPGSDTAAIWRSGVQGVALGGAVSRWFHQCCHRRVQSGPPIWQADANRDDPRKNPRNQ